ncbi:VOC family protein [Bacillus carboniphilus]|uniref:VOC family protein n=1 Tax=Bacillus carboniphilus TaxID=86663 RepID=A0ABN0WHL4_9BACI
MKADKVFVNLPVKNLNQTMEFFSKLGVEFVAQFTNEDAACMKINDHIFSMLLTEKHFKNFTTKEIADSTKHTEVIVSLSAESKDQVNDIVKRALEAGGKPSSDSQDHGFMYQWGFQDLDGHLWEVLFMDESNLSK